MLEFRIVYIRWDYVDRSAANFHGLWASNPDGTAAGEPVRQLHHAHQRLLPAAGHPRLAASSLFVAGAHHADVGGSLVLLDPRARRLDPKTGEDRFDAIESLTPEVCFPEAAGWPKSYFHSPWPLSEDYFLVSSASIRCRA